MKKSFIRCSLLVIAFFTNVSGMEVDGADAHPTSLALMSSEEQEAIMQNAEKTAARLRDEFFILDSFNPGFVLDNGVFTIQFPDPMTKSGCDATETRVKKITDGSCITANFQRVHKGRIGFDLFCTFGFDPSKLTPPRAPTREEIEEKQKARNEMEAATLERRAIKQLESERKLKEKEEAEARRKIVMQEKAREKREDDAAKHVEEAQVKKITKHAKIVIEPIFGCELRIRNMNKFCAALGRVSPSGLDFFEEVVFLSFRDRPVATRDICASLEVFCQLAEETCCMLSLSDGFTVRFNPRYAKIFFDYIRLCKRPSDFQIETIMVAILCAVHLYDNEKAIVIVSRNHPFMQLLCFEDVFMCSGVRALPDTSILKKQNVPQPPDVIQEVRKTGLALDKAVTGVGELFARFFATEEDGSSRIKFAKLGVAEEVDMSEAILRKNSECKQRGESFDPLLFTRELPGNYYSILRGWNFRP